MASSVFFKFKSQKEPQRVTFDGTGISVFELKREIISLSRLGDGTDFDLKIYNEDTNEEYDDDTTIIPRSTSVVAKRTPALKPGMGRAARYVSGKMPVLAKNSYRSENNPATSNSSQPTGPPSTSGVTAMQNAQTEEEKIAAMFQAGAEQWEQTKQQMAGVTAIHRPGGVKGKAANVPDHPPPPAYVCYRCSQKGHWIQACPTNNDPNFDGRPRVKRTTGIPRSFLQTVEKPASAGDGSSSDDARQPSGVMVNAAGDFVVAVPDKASWEKFQEKAKASAAKDDVTSAIGSKELQEHGLECPIDKRLFVDPVKTPCCSKTYCNDCIENALVNSDLVCPSCSTEGVLIDNLTPDEDTIEKIKVYEAERKKREAEKKAAAVGEAATKSPKPSSVNVKPVEANQDEKDWKETKSPDVKTEEVDRQIEGSSTPENRKKRKAEGELENEHRPDGPQPMKNEDSAQGTSVKPLTDDNFVEQMNAMAKSQGFDPDALKHMNDMLATMNGSNTFVPSMNNNMNMNMNGMPDPMTMMMMMGGGMNNMGNPMSMMGMPPFNNGMMNSMGNGMDNGMGNFSPFSNMNMNDPSMFGMNGMNVMSGMNGMNGMDGGMDFMPHQGWQGGINNGNGMMPMNNPFQQQNGNGSFQQFPQQPSNHVNEDDAYMRKPVNPHRYQGRQRKTRPTDYREL